MDEQTVTPEVAARRTELAKINAEAGPWNLDKESRAAKLYPAPTPKPVFHPNVEIEFGLSAGGSTAPAPVGAPQADAEMRARNEATLAPLRTEWGSEFDARFTDASTAARLLATGREAQYAEFDSAIRQHYGPKGEAAAVKFLADLTKIKREG